MREILASVGDYGMPTEVFNVLQILLIVLSIVISVIGIVSIIKPIFDHRHEKRMNDMKNKINNMENTIKNLNNRLLVFSGKLNLTENIFLDNYGKDISYIQLNNFGMIYLKKARLVEDNVGLREQYIDEAIKHFEESVKSFNKKYGTTLNKGCFYGLDIIYSNLSDAYDDYADYYRLSERYEEYKRKAETCCNNAIKVNEHCWQAYNMLGSIYLDKYFNSNETDFINKAKYYADKSLKLNQYNGYAYLTLAEIEITRGYEKNKETIILNINRALANGCPVWEYIDGNKDNRYTQLIEDTSDSIETLKCKIDTSKQVSNIARISLQSESEYLV